jgi:hypothetical protein
MNTGNTEYTETPKPEDTEDTKNTETPKPENTPKPDINKINEEGKNKIIQWFIEKNKIVPRFTYVRSKCFLKNKYINNIDDIKDNISSCGDEFIKDNKDTIFKVIVSDTLQKIGKKNDDIDFFKIFKSIEYTEQYKNLSDDMKQLIESNQENLKKTKIKDFKHYMKTTESWDAKLAAPKDDKPWQSNLRQYGGEIIVGLCVLGVLIWIAALATGWMMSAGGNTKKKLYKRKYKHNRTSFRKQKKSAKRKISRK